MSNSAVNGFPPAAEARLCPLGLAFVFLLIAALASCNGPGGKEEYAYVTAPDAVLRDRVAAVYTKTGALRNGERVTVLEHMPNRRFVRVRSLRGEEGWIQERYLTDQETYDQFQHLQQQYKDTPAQAVAETKAAVNLHVTPGRKTEHLYQLNEKDKVELLQRQTADKNAVGPPAAQQKSEGKDKDRDSEPEPGTGEEDTPAKPGVAPIMEDWWLIRDAQKRVGWVLGRMLYVDVPIDIAQYAEGHRIVAFYVLTQAQDEGKSVPEYLVLLEENKDGLPYDYDQVRVFTWNVRRHRYETAFHDSGLMGFLPVTLGREKFEKEGELRTFTLRLADEANAIHDQKYKFDPPIVRQVLAPGEQPVGKVHHKPATTKRPRTR